MRCAPKGISVESRKNGVTDFLTSISKEPPLTEHGEEASDQIKFEKLKVGFHNISSLKSNSQKLESLALLGKEESLDIIGIAETNINEEEGRWINLEQQGYRSF